MGIANEQLPPARWRAFQCSATAAAVILVHCSDPAAAWLSQLPGPTAGPARDVSMAATWTPTILKFPKGVITSAANDVNDAGMVVGVVTVQGKRGRTRFAG